MKEDLKLLQFFPSDKFLVELEIDKSNPNAEELAGKLLASAVRGDEILPGLKVTKIYPSVATVENIGKRNARIRLDDAIKHLEDAKDHLVECLSRYKYTELTTEEYNTIGKML